MEQRDESGQEGSLDGVEWRRGEKRPEEVHRFSGFLVHFGWGRER